MGKEAGDSGEFWLPDDFFSDDFFLEKPSSDGSTPSSPVESVAGAESENEDELVAGLTQQLANSFSAFGRDNRKASVMATSPQSTLCGIGSWSFGSPEGPSQVSSPPSTPFPPPPQRDEALDLLYAAAGQVVSLGLSNDNYDGHGHLHPSISKNHKMGPLSNHSIFMQHLQAARFYELRRQQLLKQQQQLAARLAAREMGPLGLSTSAWPPLQKRAQAEAAQAQAQARAHFLSGAGRRESRGTGVFLPRRAVPQTEPKKKPSCSSVVLPARVVQALNLNLDDVTVNPRVPGTYVLDQGSRYERGNTMQFQGKRSPVPYMGPAHDARLPTEWTY